MFYYSKHDEGSMKRKFYFVDRKEIIFPQYNENFLIESHEN